MKIILIVCLALIASCTQPNNKEELKLEIIGMEKSFEKMCAEKGIAEAFYFFADDSAVIKRQNDTLIVGKKNIKDYYNKDFYKTANVTWAPDFVDVSDDGTLAYTFGKYVWKAKNELGDETEFTGVFHTVWKRQQDNSWKYVWD